jgi:hypothetical protein
MGGLFEVKDHGLPKHGPHIASGRRLEHAMLNARSRIRGAAGLAGGLLGLLLAVSSPRGDIVVPPLRSIVSVAVEANVTYDPETALYTYAYTVTSQPTSVHDVWFFALEFPGTVAGTSGPNRSACPFSLRGLVGILGYRT